MPVFKDCQTAQSSAEVMAVYKDCHQRLPKVLLKCKDCHQRLPKILLKLCMCLCVCFCVCVCVCCVCVCVCVTVSVCVCVCVIERVWCGHFWYCRIEGSSLFATVKLFHNMVLKEGWLSNCSMLLDEACDMHLCVAIAFLDDRRQVEWILIWLSTIDSEHRIDRVGCG